MNRIKLAALAMLVGIGLPLLLPAAANAAPTWCANGQYCVDNSIQPLNGAGLDATAFFYFHRHDTAGKQITITGVKVVNRNNAACTYEVEVWDSGTFLGQGTGWRCGEFHNFSFQVSNAAADVQSNSIQVGGVMKVWVFPYPDDSQFAYHSLAVRDFCSVQCA